MNKKSRIKTLSIISLSFIFFTCSEKASAYSPNEAKFLASVKTFKVSSLKKNTNTELIAIGKTMCGDTYYRKTIEDIYLKNHYIPNTKSDVAIFKSAQKYICAKKITIVYSDGSSQDARVYDDSTQVIDGGVIESSGNNNDPHNHP